MDFSSKTHNFFRGHKIRCGKTERFINAGRKKIKLDLFNFIDQVALISSGNSLEWASGIYAIQDTGSSAGSNGNGNARVEKIRSEKIWPFAENWLQCNGKIVVMNWVKLGERFHLRYTFIKDQTSEIIWNA